MPCLCTGPRLIPTESAVVCTPPPACLQDRIFVDVTGCPGFAINLPGFSLAINLG